MSILGLFDIGKSALYASQTALSVTGNNIANAQTPGYSKESVILSVSGSSPTTYGVGGGVSITSIMRSYNRFIEAQLRGQHQNQGKSSALDQAWGQVEQVFNEASGAGLSSALSDYFNAWQDVATDPASSTARDTLLQRADTLTMTAKNIESSITSTVNGLNTGISDAVQKVNKLAADIAQLNNAIVATDAAGTNDGSSNALRDQRDQKLTELADLVDYSSYEDANGSLTINVGMRNLVAGDRTNTLSAITNAEGNKDLYLDGINITAAANQGGTIGGLLTARDDIQSGVLTDFRKLAASITQQVNLLHRAGYGLDASTGNDFFNPLQLSTTDDSAGADITATITDPALLTLDEYRITFSGGNYSVTNKQSGSLVTSGAYVSGGTISLPGIDLTITGAVTSSDSFTVSPLTGAITNFGVALTDSRQIAAASSAPQVPGDNSNASLIAQLGTSAQAGLGNATFSGFYSGIVSTVGVQKETSADSLTFDQNLTEALQAQRDSVSGVSLDEEAANLIRYQRSYEAGARMITVADELLQTLLNL